MEQDHAQELVRALQERENRVSYLEQERQYAYDSVSRLQENLRQRNAELAEYTKRIREREADVEELREGLTKQKRDHARIVDEQSRKISEVVAREVEARHNMERSSLSRPSNAPSICASLPLSRMLFLLCLPFLVVSSRFLSFKLSSVTHARLHPSCASTQPPAPRDCISSASRPSLSPYLLAHGKDSRSGLALYHLISSSTMQLVIDIGICPESCAVAEW